MYLNQCNFIGRLGADPEKRATNTGKSVTSFRIAVSEKRGGSETVEWISVICWEKTADFVADYMRKGNLAYVSGRMQTRSWEDKEGGKRFTTEIVANTVQNLSPKSDAALKDDYQHSTGEDTPF